MVQIDLLFKLAGLGVVVAVLCQVLTRAGREELSTLVTVVGLVIALFLVVDLVADLFSSLQSIFALYSAMAFWQWMGLAVTAAVLCLLVRQQQPQLGGLCAAAAGVMLLLAALEQLADVREVFARLTGMAGIEEGYLNTLVKVLGVSYVAELAAQTCQDLGEGGLALKVGLVGKLCVFTLTAPMLLSLLEMILELTP